MGDKPFTGFEEGYVLNQNSQDSRMTVEDLASIKEKSEVIRSLKKGSEFGLSVVGRTYTLVGAPVQDKENSRMWRFSLILESTGSRTQFTNWQMGSILIREKIQDDIAKANQTWYEYYENSGVLVRTFHVTDFRPKFVDDAQEKPWLPVYSFDPLKIEALTKGRSANKLAPEVHQILAESFSDLDTAQQNKRMGYIRLIRNRYELKDYIYDSYLEAGSVLNIAGKRAQQGQLVVDPLVEKSAS